MDKAEAMDVVKELATTLSELRAQQQVLDDRYKYKRCYIVRNYEREEDIGVVVTSLREAEFLANRWKCMYDETYIYIPRKKEKKK
jgi:hypothetical protein